MALPTTTYQKHLAAIVGQQFHRLAPEQLIDKLFEMGVVDFTRCKILVVRQFVEAMVGAGRKKVDAMWHASEHFACSYEYVRKCMYYYADVKVD